MSPWQPCISTNLLWGGGSVSVLACYSTVLCMCPTQKTQIILQLKHKSHVKNINKQTFNVKYKLACVKSHLECVFSGNFYLHLTCIDILSLSTDTFNLTQYNKTSYGSIFDRNIQPIYWVIVPMFSCESKFNPGTLRRQNSNTASKKNFCPLFCALLLKISWILKWREKVQGYWLTKPNPERQAGSDG